MTISELVNRYSADRNRCIKSDYNETQLRTDYLDPLFQLLNWDIRNEQGKPFNQREVVLEEPIRGSISEHSKKPDYTFRLFSERKFFLEAKKPSKAIERSDEAAKQVRRYGFTAKLKISVLSNFEYLLIYDCSTKVDPSDSFNKALIKKYHYTEYEMKFDEISRLLGQVSVYNGIFDEEWKSIEDKIEHFSVDTLFLQQINDWRKGLGNEIFKYQPNIQEHVLNDCVQSYINRIIFLRVCEDRNQEIYETLLSYANLGDFKALIAKFAEADTKYNSGLFNQYLSDQIIGNISSVFWTIIRQLYYPESPYSFSVFSSDILGNIYEIFLSEKLSTENGVISLVKKPENVDRDVVTTPTFIIHQILNQTVVEYCHGKNDLEIMNLKAADIACGSGAFLIELYQLLNDLLIDFYLKYDESQLINTDIGAFKLPFTKKKQILLNCIFGTDKDYNAVEAAKFGLLLKLLEGESNNTVGELYPILPSLKDNIHYGNTLISPNDINNSEISDIVNPFDFGNTRYDVIVGNPPYMKSEDMKKFTPLEYPIYKQKFITASAQFDKYFVFIEQGMRLLKDGGYLGYIAPNKFFKVGSGLALREYLTTNGYLNTVTSFVANQVFANKTTYTCLLTLKKTPSEEFKYAEVSSIKNWRTMHGNEIDYLIAKTKLLDNNSWVLVPPALTRAYKKILSLSKHLKDIVGEENITNGIQTSLNPVYVITKFTLDKNFIYFEKDHQPFKVERELVRPYYNTPSSKIEKQKFHTSNYLRPNAFVVFPYKSNNDQIEIIPEPELERVYPEAFKYLKHYARKIKKRDVSPPMGDDDWYKFGRSQHLNSWNSKEKIVVGVLSTGNKYPIDLHKTIVSSGGTAGYCIIAMNLRTDYSIYYVQAILNSKYVEWFASLYGEVFRGGYIARGTKVLKRLPIRSIDFNSSEERAFHDDIVRLQLSIIYKQQEINNNPSDARSLVVLRRQMANLKAESDQMLKKLYNLGTDDEIIPEKQ